MQLLCRMRAQPLPLEHPRLLLVRARPRTCEHVQHRLCLQAVCVVPVVLAELVELRHAADQADYRVGQHG